MARSRTITTKSSRRDRSSMPRWLRSMFGSSYEIEVGRPRLLYASSGSYERLRPTSSRSASSPPYCSACGKFRSPAWQSRNPYAGHEGGLCKKCASKSTSEEEPNPHDRCKKHGRRYCGRCYHSSDSGLPASVLRRPRKRRDRSSRSYRTDRLSGSTDGVNVVVQNHIGDDAGSRVNTLESSDDEEVRVVRRGRSTARLPRIHLSDLDDERLDRYFPRRRSLSRARYADPVSLMELD